MQTTNTNKFCLFLILILLGLGANAQQLEASFNSLMGSKDKLPFHLWANQLGRYDQNSSTIQNFEFMAAHQLQLGESDFSVEGLANVTALLADENDFRFTELYAGLNWKFIQIKVGAFADAVQYNNLSVSNGNLASSRNARPHPSVRMGFNRYVNLTNWLAINGFYEEGLLNDDRYVEDAHFHRKALYLRFGNPKSIRVTGGMEHFVMWGGTHPEYGELEGWEKYFDYVMGSRGDENSLMTDQKNIVGNQYGAYQLDIHKRWETFGLTFYLSHPFDDYSGLNWENHLDNLLGLLVEFEEEKPLIKSIDLEYYHTKNQSGTVHLIKEPDGSFTGHGQDDYYNHGVYRSGSTYHQMAMVSPLFAPVKIENGISMGFDNTRFSGFHAGAEGFLMDRLKWKGLFTYTKNFGKYKGNVWGSVTETYYPPRQQAAGLFQLNYQFKDIPLYLGAGLAADHGSLFDFGTSTTRLGAMLSVQYKILD